MAAIQTQAQVQTVVALKQDKDIRFCTLNFPYKFRVGDAWLKPDDFGIYTPKNKEEQKELEYQYTKGLVCKEADLVPPVEAEE